MPAGCRERQADGGIEMRAGDRAEDGDQHNQHRPGRDRVGEQGKRAVVRQTIGHHAGADDGGDQHAGPEHFRP